MTTPSWTDLEERCDTALSLSRDLLARLEDGTDAVDLVPLLTREQEALEDLLTGIGQVRDAGPGDAATAADRDAIRQSVATNLRELLQTDDRSRQILSRRGVRLRAPRGRRFAHRAGGARR
jgi:hypothetical protein